MPDENIPEFGIETRPFLGDIFIRTSNDEEQEQPAAVATAGHAHLFAAATGKRLHLVDTPAPATPAEPEIEEQPAPREEPIRTRSHVAPLPGYTGRADLDVVDWDLVDSLVKQLSLDSVNDRSRMEFDVAIAADGPETEFEDEGLVEIRRLVDRHVEYKVMNSGPDFEWPAAQREQHVQAVFDSAFRYGRLQQYLREPDVEDISIVGYDSVMVTKSTGLKEFRRPAARNNDELERIISDVASWRGRAFSRPNGHIDLDIGGARFSATGRPITSVPNITMRKHGHIDVTLQDMQRLGTITNKMLGLLTTCGQANLSALISGWAAAGKTSFLRAWMSSIPFDEKIVTIETEHELYLNKQSYVDENGQKKLRHAQVQDFQYLPSNLVGSDVTATYSLEDAFRESLRSSAQRILFGEIRGAEGPVAIKAMQAGKGSVSTIHAKNADDAIHRFSTILMTEQRLSDDTVPLRQIMRSIDIVVHLDVIPNPDGTRRRIVSEIAEVVPNDNQLPIASQLFAWDYDREIYTMPNKPSPGLLRLLERNGLNTEYFWEGAE